MLYTHHAKRAGENNGGMQRIKEITRVWLQSFRSHMHATTAKGDHPRHAHHSEVDVQEFFLIILLYAALIITAASFSK